jgi:hypothetical protein
MLHLQQARYTNEANFFGKPLPCGGTEYRSRTTNRVYKLTLQPDGYKIDGGPSILIYTGTYDRRRAIRMIEQTDAG